MWWLTLLSSLLVLATGTTGVINCGIANTLTSCKLGVAPEEGSIAYFSPTNTQEVFIFAVSQRPLECTANSFASVQLLDGNNQVIADCSCLDLTRSEGQAKYCTGVEKGTIAEGSYAFEIGLRADYTYRHVFTVTHTQQLVATGTVTSTNTVVEFATSTTTTTSTDTATDFSAQTTVTRPASSTTVTVVVSSKALTVYTTSTRVRTRTRASQTYLSGTITTTPACKEARQAPSITKEVSRVPMDKRAGWDPYSSNRYLQGDGPLTTTGLSTVFILTTSTTSTTEIETATVSTTVTSPNPTPTTTVYTGINVSSTTTTAFRSTKTKIAYVNSYTTTTITSTFDRRITRTAAPSC